MSPENGGITERCVRCGEEAEYLVGGVPVCDECYTIYGSCCMEFGADDLWSKTESRESERTGV